jgi:uncharacterized membrane protein YkoI
MKAFIGRLAILVAESLIATSWLSAAEEQIKADQLPKAVADAVKARFPGLEFTSIAKETEADGSIVYDIELTQKGRKFETDVKADGTLLEVEKEVAQKDWPKPLQATVETKFPKATVKEVLEVNLVKDKKEIPDHLEVTLDTADKKSEELLTSLDGKTIKEEPTAGAAKEEKVEAAQLPKAVSDAVNARFPGLKFTSITKETEADGRVVYDIELTQKDRKFETDVKEDGTLLEVEKEVAQKDWPKALQGTVEGKFPKATINEVLEVNLVKDKKEVPDHLEVTVETADKKSEEVLTSLDGKNVVKEESAPAGGAAQWRDKFNVDKANFVSVGTNPYFILEPGYTLKLKAEGASLTIKVLNETKLVDGVQTRIVEEREEQNGQPIEISRNYFAIDKKTLDLFYFGEDVDMYKDGKITSHEGSWLAGVDGAKAGLMMPGKPKVGDKYYQEMAPGKAMDRAEIVSVDVELKTPAGTFRKCIRTSDTSAIEAGTSEKIYAPDVGPVKDDEFKLVEIARPKGTR